MDGLDFFRKLSSGAKFNLKRFGKDAQQLKVFNSQLAHPNKIVTQPESEKKRKLEELPVPAKRRKENDTEDSDESEDAESEPEGSSSDSGENEGSSSEEEQEVELKLLGDMRAAGGVDVKQNKKDKKSKAKQTAEKMAAIKKEELSHFRRKNHIHTYGTDIPDTMENFDVLVERFGLHKKIVENLKTYGYETPTPIQMQAVPAMMHRREVLACAPTGSGKTAAFIIPVLHHLQGPQKKGFRALVLAPTRELAKQIHQEFTRLSDGLGFRIHLIEKAATALKKFGPKSSQKFDILVTTPNRLVYLLQQDPAPIRLNNVEWLVVDESDKLFEEGKTGFRDQLAEVYKACDSSNVRRAMFSATFAHQVEEWCKLNLDNLLHVNIGARNAANEEVKQELIFVGSEQGKLLAMQDVIRKGLTPPILVFVQSKERAKELFHELVYDGINVDVIHSDRTQTQRDNIVNGFRSGKIWVLICTELMGRGIDFKGVNLVINYDFPNSAISYIHRIGRTGRAGREGRAVTFFTEDDMVNLRSIANVMREAGCPVPEYMLSMKLPNKKTRKKNARNSIPRSSIRTVPQQELNQSRARRKMTKYKQTKEQQQRGNTEGQSKSPGGQKRKQSDNSSGESMKFKKSSPENQGKNTDGKSPNSKQNGVAKPKKKILQKKLNGKTSDITKPKKKKMKKVDS